MAVRVGIVGTGYAARVRAEALRSDVRSHPVAVAGNDFARTASFAETYGLEAIESWQSLLSDATIDLVVVATVSGLHGVIVEAALASGKHVVVEYPLSLDLAQARRLIEFAAQKDLLLHVEHIELLGGLHLAMREHLPRIGVPSYVNYRTLNPQHPAPRKWTYHRELFGFPFCGALSRVHRLTNLLGRVKAVSCCTRMVTDEVDSAYFKSILSSARLEFENGVVAELTYGKGENLWSYSRTMEVQGSLGALRFVRDQGTLTMAQGDEAIAVAPRRGLFVKDTEMVLDYLTKQTPLYVSPAESLYALMVGDALRQASESGQPVNLDNVGLNHA
ncbi:MAG: Gfo/Idh/MocA family oxidoreductase [Phormidesmis sp.]